VRCDEDKRRTTTPRRRVRDREHASAQPWPHRQIKRVIYLHEGGDRVVEAAVHLSPAPGAAEATVGEIHLVLHPLRTVAT
jgi:hypothetical protein